MISVPFQLFPITAQASAGGQASSALPDRSWKAYAV